MKTQEKIPEKEEVKAKPKQKWTIYPVTITEWDNKGISSYTIQKSYKDDKGEWHNTDNFNESDCCVIAKILSKI
jgi:hypothetical protein